MSEPADRPSRARSLVLAWGVHFFTASGAVVGALALLAISAGELDNAALLMLFALFIDAVDGSLARAVGVSEVLPDVDGRRLDDIVDFLNFVIVPVVFMTSAGSLPGWGWVAAPILASAYGFSQASAKTEDDFFLGWPSYWNVVALYCWLLDLSTTTGAFWLVVCSIGIFLPFKYVYPSKLAVLRKTTTVGGLLWGALVTAAIVDPEAAAEAVAADQVVLAASAAVQVARVEVLADQVASVEELQIRSGWAIG